MRKNTACLFLFSSLLSISGMAENRKDSTQVGRNYVIVEVVVPEHAMKRIYSICL